MANYSDGRMLRKDISKSSKLDDLSKESIVLFLMLIPHYTSHGKMNGEPAFIKGEVVPRLKWFTIPLIEKCLKEINDKTNVKWFEFEGLNYIHSLTWFDHQKLDKNKIGNDKLPSYSGVTPELGKVTPELLTHKVEVKEEVEEEDKDKDKDKEEDKVKDKSFEKLVFSSFNNVYLTADEHQKLSSRFGSRLDVMLESLGSYIASHGAERKYKSHYATIIQWSLKDNKQSTLQDGFSIKKDQVPSSSRPATDTELKSYCCYAPFTDDKRCSVCNEDYSPIRSGIKIALNSV